MSVDCSISDGKKRLELGRYSHFHVISCLGDKLSRADMLEQLTVIMAGDPDYEGEEQRYIDQRVHWAKVAKEFVESSNSDEFEIIPEFYY